MLGTFEIEATGPIVDPADMIRLPAALNFTVQLEPSATIEIVFEEGTDIHQATKDLYAALISLGLTGP